MMLLDKGIQLKVIWSLTCIHLRKNNSEISRISILTNWRYQQELQIKKYIFKNLMIRKLLPEMSFCY